MNTRMHVVSLTLALTAGSALAQNCSPILLPRVDGPVLPPVQFLAAGDMNGDGFADLIACDFPSPQVSVRFGRSAALGGGFAAPVITPLPAFYSPGRVRAIDFNGDGILDLYGRTFDTANPPPPQHLLLGRPDGTFATGQVIEPDVSAAAFADLNFDGRIDVVGFRPSSNELLLYTNRSGAAGGGGGGGGVGVDTFTVTSLGNPTPSSGQVFVGDLTADGRPDVLIIYVVSSVANLRLLRQEAPTTPGDVGAFTPFASSTLDAIPGGRSLLIDADGDGTLDLVNTAGTAFARFRHGFGGGLFGTVVDLDPVSFTMSDVFNNIQLLDVNGDGIPDLVRHVTDTDATQPSKVLVKFGMGGGRFVPAQTLPASPRHAATFGTRGCVTAGNFGGTGNFQIIADSLNADGLSPEPSSLFHYYRVPEFSFSALPAAQRTRPGQPAVFTVGVAGDPSVTISYRWLKNGVALPPDVEGGRISGATGPVLTINDTRPDDAGVYIVEVSNLCLTRQAFTSLETSSTCGDIDFNLDGDFNADDLGDFITAYFGGGC